VLCFALVKWNGLPYFWVWGLGLAVGLGLHPRPCKMSFTNLSVYGFGYKNKLNFEFCIFFFFLYKQEVSKLNHEGIVMLASLINNLILHTSFTSFFCGRRSLLKDFLINIIFIYFFIIHFPE
jgi:hypothetical protein